MSKSAPSRFVALDGLRGVAAVAVMLLHFTEKNSTFAAGAYKPFGSSYLAVDLFFVLSGLVIYRSYAAQLDVRLSAQDYLIKRAIRLYPLFLIGVALGAVSLALSLNATSVLPLKSALRDFSFNALGLPCPNADALYNFGSPTPNVGELFPTNPPAWSLFFEGFASVAFVFLYRLEAARLLKLSLAAFAALALAGLAVSAGNATLGFTLGLGWGSANFLAGFPRVLFSFLAGVCIAKRLETESGFSTRWRGDRAALGLYGLALAGLALPNLAAGIFALAFILLISPALVWFGAQVEPASGFVRRGSEALGWLSFPLYCVHFPVGRIVWRFGAAAGLSQPDLVAACVLCSVGVAILAGVLIDEPVRRWLAHALLTRSEAGVAPLAGPRRQAAA